LNFGDTELSQPNLIRAKERTLSSADPHQNLPVMSNLQWEIQGRVSSWWYVFINGRPGQIVMMFKKFILNTDFLKNISKTLNQRSFDFNFFQKARVVI
jgi:hypothetical protein